MNDFQRWWLRVQLGIKAVQNIKAAHHAFERLSSCAEEADGVVRASLFHFAVIRYAKPFVSADTGCANATYRLRWIRGTPGFDREMHDHLLNLRHTLIAHDDLTQVPPRILFYGVQDPSTGNNIPLAAVVSNKCLAYPSEAATTERMRKHVHAALSGAEDTLANDLYTLRQRAISNPEEAQASRLGSETLEVLGPGESLIRIPDIGSHPSATAQVPDFSHIHNGFRYDDLRMRLEFLETIEIVGADGKFLRVEPVETEQELPFSPPEEGQ